MRFPLKIFRVEDRSMEPGIRAGDYLIVNRFFGRLKVGDIVVVKHPTKGISMVKRVSTTGENKIFVIGDNKEMSEDSRKFGSINVTDVIGKVILRV